MPLALEIRYYLVSSQYSWRSEEVKSNRLGYLVVNLPETFNGLKTPDSSNYLLLLLYVSTGFHWCESISERILYPFLC